MMLIEYDKRGKEYKIPLTYSKRDDEPFYISENLYIIGTMNTADRSLALVDYALRRRFAFIDLSPKFNDKFKDFIGSYGDNDFLVTMIEKLKVLNKIIANDKNLGPGFQIGHSYFCNPTAKKAIRTWYENIIEHEIAPLLREYWFDDVEKAETEIRKLLSD